MRAKSVRSLGIIYIYIFTGISVGSDYVSSFAYRRTALQYNLSDILIKFAEIQQERNFFFSPPIFLSGRKCSIRMLMNIYMYTYPRVKLLFFKKRCKNVEKDPTFFF